MGSLRTGSSSAVSSRADRRYFDLMSPADKGEHGKQSKPACRIVNRTENIKSFKTRRNSTSSASIASPLRHSLDPLQPRHHQPYLFIRNFGGQRILNRPQPFDSVLRTNRLNLLLPLGTDPGGVQFHLAFLDHGGDKFDHAPELASADGGDLGQAVAFGDQFPRLLGGLRFFCRRNGRPLAIPEFLQGHQYLGPVRFGFALAEAVDAAQGGESRG